MRRFVFAVIELADPYDHPQDLDHLTDLAMLFENVRGVGSAIVYASLADLAYDVIDGALTLPDEALRPIHGTPKGD